MPSLLEEKRVGSELKVVGLEVAGAVGRDVPVAATVVVAGGLLCLQPETGNRAAAAVAIAAEIKSHRLCTAVSYWNGPQKG